MTQEKITLTHPRLGRLDYRQCYLGLTLTNCYGSAEIARENVQARPALVNSAALRRPRQIFEPIKAEYRQEVFCQNAPTLRWQHGRHHSWLEWSDWLSAIADCHIIKPVFLKKAELRQTLETILQGYHNISLSKQNFLNRFIVEDFQLLPAHTIAQSLHRLQSAAACLFAVDRHGELGVVQPERKVIVSREAVDFPQHWSHQESLRSPYIHALALDRQDRWQKPLGQQFALPPTANVFKRIVTENLPFRAANLYRFLHPQKIYTLEYHEMIPLLPGDIHDFPIVSDEPHPIYGQADKAFLVLESHFYHSRTHHTRSRFVLVEAGHRQYLNDSHIHTQRG